jgi:hypothetical protein
MGNSGKSVKKKFCKFYIANPVENADVDALANRLIALKNVAEVYITDCINNGGILVKTRFDEKPEDLEGFLSKHLGKHYGEVHAIAYKKTR